MKLKSFLLIILIFFAIGCNKNEAVNNKLVEQNTAKEQSPKSAIVKNNENTNKTVTKTESAEITNVNTKQNQKNNETKEIMIKLIISKNSFKEVLVEKSLKISKNINAMALLKNNATVYEEGGFIKSINGIESIPSNKLSNEDKNKGILGYDWFIYLNGKKTNLGANDIILKNGDIIDFDFKGWTVEDLAP